MPKRTGIQLAYPFDEKRLAKYNKPYIVQPKLDGERCRAVLEDDVWVLYSSTGEEINSVPHINRVLQRRTDQGQLNYTELDGELYRHGQSFEAIHSVVSRKVNMHPESYLMDFHIFDIPSIATTQAMRTKLVMDCIESSGAVKTVPSQLAHSVEDVIELLGEYTTQGFEGIMIREPYNQTAYERKRSVWMMKFKPKRHDDYQIVGFQEELSIHGEPKNSLGAFIVEDDYHATFKVGSGFTAEQRRDYWIRRHELLGRMLRVAYQHTTVNGIPRFPVYLELR